MDSPILEKVKLDKRPLSFGIQLRCVFMFEEILLRKQLGVKGVVKSIPEETRATLPFDPSRRDKTIYNSWGVVDTNSGKLRRYRYEPMEIARGLMPAAVLKVDVRESSGNPGQNVINTSWCIINDRNAPGASPELLKSRLRQTATVENWDSYGIEVLSRLMRTDRSSHIDEIMKVIDVFANPDPTYGAFVRNDTGLYVHIVAPKELGVLKELAFLTIIYEDEFSRMHPPRCRPGHNLAGSRPETNQTAFLKEVKTREESQTINDEKGSMEQFARRNGAGYPKLDFVSTIRERIEACNNETDLSELMGVSERNLVNWINLPGESRIIEFRQHRSTLDKNEIRWWIQFITGLIRVADLYYRRGGCPIKSWADRINVFDLMDEMELPEEVIEFYYMKIASYMNYPKDGPLNQAEWVPRPAESWRRNDKANIVTKDPQRGTKRLLSNLREQSPKRQKTSSKWNNVVENFDTTTKIKEIKVTAPPPALTTTVEKIPEHEPDDKSTKDLQNIPRQTRVSIPQQPEVSIPQQTGVSPDTIDKEMAIGEEMLVETGSGCFKVNRFSLDDWKILRTNAKAPDEFGLQKCNMCGIWALLGSLNGQASTLPDLHGTDQLRQKMTNLKWRDIHEAVNNQRYNVRAEEGATSMYGEEQLALGLQAIDKKLKLTIATKEDKKGIIARRAYGTRDWNEIQRAEPGYNLYIHYDHNKRHWEAMKKKDRPAPS